MWPSILLMYNINARGNDSQSTKTVYCLSNLKPLKIKTTLTKIKYKKGIKSWREKRNIYIYIDMVGMKERIETKRCDSG